MTLFAYIFTPEVSQYLEVWFLGDYSLTRNPFSTKQMTIYFVYTHKQSYTEYWHCFQKQAIYFFLGILMRISSLLELIYLCWQYDLALMHNRAFTSVKLIIIKNYLNRQNCWIDSHQCRASWEYLDLRVLKLNLHKWMYGKLFLNTTLIICT